MPVLVAHFFVFYYAVMSAITPPVALAAYAGAALSGSDPMKTSVEAFRLGLAAFIVPFMFFGSHELLMQGEWIDIIHATATALLGMFLLSAGVIGYYFGHASMVVRLVLIGAALSMIAVGWVTDLIGLSVAAALALQRAPVRAARIWSQGEYGVCVWEVADEHLDPAVLRKRLKLLDAQLDGRDFILGRRSVVDAYAFPMIRWAANLLPEGIQAWPNVQALHDRIAADPAVQRVLAREEGE